MDIRKNNKDSVEFVIDVFGHGRGLFDNNTGKNKIDNSPENDKDFFGKMEIIIDVGNH